MVLIYQEDGNLQAGISDFSIEEAKTEYCINQKRSKLFSGLELAAGHLRDCGCKTIYLDGSFVTTKEFPNDFDACWDETGVNLARLYSLHPVFFEFRNGREDQKRIYGGELFPSKFSAVANPVVWYINFFQRDKEGNPKGIIALKL